MRPALKSLWHVVQYGADCIVLCACWALWIALGVLFVVQIGIAFSRELAVPVSEFVHIVRLLTFSGSHPHLSDGRILTPDEIVTTVLDGLHTRPHPRES